MNTPITHSDYLIVQEFAQDLKEGIELTITGDNIIDRHNKTLIRFIDNMLGVYKKRFDLFDEEFAEVMSGK